jgi:hypothetical protein
MLTILFRAMVHAVDSAPHVGTVRATDSMKERVKAQKERIRRLIARTSEALTAAKNHAHGGTLLMSTSQRSRGGRAVIDVYVDSKDPLRDELVSYLRKKLPKEFKRYREPEQDELQLETLLREYVDITLRGGGGWNSQAQPIPSATAPNGTPPGLDIQPNNSKWNKDALDADEEGVADHLQDPDAEDPAADTFGPLYSKDRYKTARSKMDPVPKGAVVQDDPFVGDAYPSRRIG